MSVVGYALKARVRAVLVDHLIAACLLLLILVSIGAAEADAQDLKRVFGKTKGAFVLHDLKNKQYVRHNESRCRQRFTPASSFKIPNSLIGLETGVVRDADFVIRWDRQRYPNEGRPAIAPFIHWWQDHTLRSAMKYSAVWYYIEIAQQVGAHRMEKFVTQFRYGNGDTSGGIDQFWRNSSLQISADEQVDFLRRFYTGQLSVSSRSTAIVKDIILLEQTSAYKFSGKTGAAPLAKGGTPRGSLVTWSGMAMFTFSPLTWTARTMKRFEKSGLI